MSDLLSFWRKSKPEFNKTNPGELVSRCMRLSHQKLTLQNIRDQERIIPEIPKVFGDFNQLQLRRCIINLIFSPYFRILLWNVAQLTSEMPAALEKSQWYPLRIGAMCCLSISSRDWREFLRRPVKEKVEILLPERDVLRHGPFPGHESNDPYRQGLDP